MHVSSFPPSDELTHTQPGHTTQQLHTIGLVDGAERDGWRSGEQSTQTKHGASACCVPTSTEPKRIEPNWFPQCFTHKRARTRSHARPHAREHAHTRASEPTRAHTLTRMHACPRTSLLFLGPRSQTPATAQASAPPLDAPRLEAPYWPFNAKLDDVVQRWSSFAQCARRIQVPFRFSGGRLHRSVHSLEDFGGGCGGGFSFLDG